MRPPDETWSNQETSACRVMKAWPQVQNFSHEKEFIGMSMKAHFHMNGCAPGLTYKKRLKAFQKWPTAFN